MWGMRNVLRFPPFEIKLALSATRRSVLPVASNTTKKPRKTAFNLTPHRATSCEISAEHHQEHDAQQYQRLNR